jgi:ATP-dependent phosphofructokinase / diphosphate-dependent phosphofructokinase
VVLGHLQRGGSPNAFDRVLATRFGVAAIELVQEGKFGQMVGIKGNAMVSVPLRDVIGKRKIVDSELYEIATTFSVMQDTCPNINAPNQYGEACRK